MAPGTSIGMNISLLGRLKKKDTHLLGCIPAPPAGYKTVTFESPPRRIRRGRRAQLTLDHRRKVEVAERLRIVPDDPAAQVAP